MVTHQDQGKLPGGLTHYYPKGRRAQHSRFFGRVVMLVKEHGNL